MTIKNKTFHSVVSILAVLGGMNIGRTAAAADYEYPELLVTPKASERLEMEAKKERDAAWTRHIPVQVSGATTLVAGLVQFAHVDDSNVTRRNSPWAGVIVGGGWLVATTALSAFYNPYGSAVSEIRSLQSRTQRDQLVRERMAEEAIENAARVARRITWLSVLTNLGASAFMLGNAKSDTFAKVTDGIAMAAALTPIIFPYRWQTVASEQRSYKKRIYAPLAEFTIMPEGSTGRVAPGLVFSLAF